MDPNANLEEQLQTAQDIIKKIDAMPEDAELTDLARDANRLAELVVALNEWICRGGFLPDDWRST